jgi:hypothetical protein
MNDATNAVAGLAMLIGIVGGREWAHGPAALEQATLYMGGCRNGDIADVTFQAVELAKLIARQ